MATEKCFFSQWLCSIVTLHSVALPGDKLGPWQKVAVITDTKQIHSTSHTFLLPLERQQLYSGVLLNKGLCDTLCGEYMIWWLQFSEVMTLFDISPLHEDKPATTTAQGYHKHDRL